jgi:hypothetical protein
LVLAGLEEMLLLERMHKDLLEPLVEIQVLEQLAGVRFIRGFMLEAVAVELALGLLEVEVDQMDEM